MIVHIFFSNLAAGFFDAFFLFLIARLVVRGKIDRRKATSYKMLVEKN